MCLHNLCGKVVNKIFKKMFSKLITLYNLIQQHRICILHQVLTNSYFAISKNFIIVHHYTIVVVTILYDNQVLIF